MIKAFILLFLFCCLISTNELQANAIKHQVDESQNSQLITSLIKLSAHLSIPLGELVASDAAAEELYLFRTGKHDGLPVVFQADTIKSKELLEGDYYQELTDYLITAMSRWYGGDIPASGGLYLHSDVFRVFGPGDFITEVINGIDMADIIGTFTYFIRVTSNNGILTFHATNVMSLGSYAGENYFKHNLVTNPEVGPLQSRVQVFQWQRPIPIEQMAEK